MLKKIEVRARYKGWMDAELRNVSKNRRRNKVSRWTELYADKNEYIYIFESMSYK